MLVFAWPPNFNTDYFKNKDVLPGAVVVEWSVVLRQGSGGPQFKSCARQLKMKFFQFSALK